MISLLASIPLTRERSAILYADGRQHHRCSDDYDTLVAFIRSRGREVLNDPLLEDWGPGLLSMV